jgi:hypothetical protein
MLCSHPAARSYQPLVILMLVKTGCRAARTLALRAASGTKKSACAGRQEKGRLSPAFASKAVERWSTATAPT